MGQTVVNVGSFDKYSYNGVTVYGTTQNFTIPANEGITGCSVSFVTHAADGNTADRAFSLNGSRAHSSGSWAQNGALNHALLTTGDNTFRVTLKSTTPGGYTVCWWDISSITLTITYNDVGGGDPPPPPNIGTITLNKSSMLAGETVTVSLSPCDNGIYRSIRVKWQGELITSLIIGGDVPSGGDYTYTFPLADCSRMPGDTSGTLTFEMETSVDITSTKIMTIEVPSSVVPTIGAFTATRNANGVDASITKYVQNYSKVSLAMGGVAGALGSSIQSYEITGAGFSAAAASASFGPFAQTGDITFTAKVTDTRGRTATKAATINVLPYAPVSAVNISAIRSDASGTTQDEGVYASLRGKRVFSLLGGENSAIIKGRVFERNTSPPGWTNMIDDTLTLFGSLSIEKAYTAQISIEDKITSVIYVIEIPTSIVGIHILPGATGGGFGMYGRDGCWDFSAPLFSPEGACPGIGDILVTLNSASPAVRFPDTTWSAIEGVFLLGADSTYIAGSTGGETVHVLTESEMPIHHHAIWSLNWEVATGPSGGATATAYGAKGDVSGNAGSGDAHNNMPPYLSVYLWERTA